MSLKGKLALLLLFVVALTAWLAIWALRTTGDALLSWVAVVGVGVLSDFASDFTAVLTLAIVLAVLSVFALGGIRRAL